MIKYPGTSLLLLKYIYFKTQTFGSFLEPRFINRAQVGGCAMLPLNVQVTASLGSGDGMGVCCE